MNSKGSQAALTIFVSVLAGAAAASEQSYQWKIDAPITRWDEALPLGNGLTGCLVWGEGNLLRFSFDRGDLWDNRMPPELTEPGFTYANLQKLVREKNTEEIARLTDRPYKSPYPTKLPGLRLQLTMKEEHRAREFVLDMKQALGEIRLGEDAVVRAFVCADEPVTLIHAPAFEKAELVVPTSVKQLGYEAPASGREGDSLWWSQKTLDGLEYGAFLAVKKVGEECLVAVAMTSNRENKDFMASARKRAEDALEKGFEGLLASHLRWWLDYWAKSNIALPDAKHQRYYKLMQYFFGSASRKGAPPMPLQGVWTADGGGLPPWKGDLHNDTNVQMCYWPYYASGHFECGESMLDFFLGLAPVHRRFAREFFGVDGLLVPGVMGGAGQPLTGWAQYSLSPTMSVWLLQNFHWHWLYTMDRQFLKGKCYPYCREMAGAVEALLEPGPGGWLKLPLSSSPEIYNNSLRAWLTPNSNNDLALLHWMCDALTDMAAELGLREDVARWRRLRSKLEPLAVDENGALLLGPDEPLGRSHRHHSHLMAIHPLGTLSIENDDSDRRVVLASLDELRRLGTSAWVGFSFPWASCLEARAGRAEAAYRYLDIFVDHFTSRNGFNLNGQQRGEEKHSNFSYRPFTLEANFGAARAIHEMLLQSWGGTIRIFPSVPTAWADVSFEKLRAEGGFLVSATREGGKTVRVEITATVERDLRLRTPFGKTPLKWNRSDAEQQGEYIQIRLKAGETLKANL